MYGVYEWLLWIDFPLFWISHYILNYAFIFFLTDNDTPNNIWIYFNILSKKNGIFGHVITNKKS